MDVTGSGRQNIHVPGAGGYRIMVDIFPNHYKKVSVKRNTDSFKWCTGNCWKSPHTNYCYEWPIAKRKQVSKIAEVKSRRKLYILRNRLAWLSIYGRERGLYRKYKASSPSPQLPLIPLRLRSSGPMSVEYSDTRSSLPSGPCQRSVRILLYTIPWRVSNWVRYRTQFWTLTTTRKLW